MSAFSYDHASDSWDARITVRAFSLSVGLSSVMPCLAQRINNSIPGIHNLLPCFADLEL